MSATPAAGEAAALALARLGYRVHPVRSDKRPFLNGWPTRATDDPEAVRKLWRDHPNAAVGLAAGSGFAVLDLDVKGRENGVEAWTAWADAEGIPWAPTTATPSGGAHVFLATPETFKNTAGVVLPGVDVRSEGGYVVAYTTDLPSLDELPPLPPKVGRLIRREAPSQPSSATSSRTDHNGRVTPRKENAR